MNAISTACNATCAMEERIEEFLRFNGTSSKDELLMIAQYLKMIDDDIRTAYSAVRRLITES